MFEKDLHIAYLLDFYGEVLPEKTHRVMSMYYDEDLSLSEIAAGEGISRQGVRHLIKHGEEELLRLESALGLASRYAALQSAADALDRASDSLSDTQETAQLRDAIRSCVQLIRNS